MKVLIGSVIPLIIIAILSTFEIYIAPFGIFFIFGLFPFAGMFHLLYSDYKEMNKLKFLIPFIFFTGSITGQVQKKFDAKYHIVIPHKGELRMEIIESTYTVTLTSVLYKDEVTPENKPLILATEVEHQIEIEDRLNLSIYVNENKMVYLYTDIKSDKFEYMIYHGVSGIYYVIADKALAESMFNNIKSSYASLTGIRL